MIKLHKPVIRLCKAFTHLTGPFKVTSKMHKGTFFRIKFHVPKQKLLAFSRGPEERGSLLELFPSILVPLRLHGAELWPLNKTTWKQHVRRGVLFKDIMTNKYALTLILVNSKLDKLCICLLIAFQVGGVTTWKLDRSLPLFLLYLFVPT